jgi:hypothetical protein
MIIIKVLGIIDIVIGLLFWVFGVFNIEAMSGFIFLLGLFLLAKGIAFSTQLAIASILDVVSSGIIIYGSAFQVNNLMVVIVSIFLLQKGVFSMLG